MSTLKRSNRGKNWTLEEIDFLLESTISMVKKFSPDPFSVSTSSPNFGNLYAKLDELFPSKTDHQIMLKLRSLRRNFNNNSLSLMETIFQDKMEILWGKKLDSNTLSSSENSMDFESNDNGTPENAGLNWSDEEVKYLVHTMESLQEKGQSYGQIFMYITKQMPWRKYEEIRLKCLDLEHRKEDSIELILPTNENNIESDEFDIKLLTPKIEEEDFSASTINDVQSKVCRACCSNFTENDVIHLFSGIDEEFAIPVSDVFTGISKIEVEEDDKLPQYVCVQCYETLKIAYAFQQKCIESNTRLLLEAQIPVDIKPPTEFVNVPDHSADESKPLDVIKCSGSQSTKPQNTIQKCFHCRDKFNSLSALKLHYIQVKPFRCRKCSNSFSSSKLLENHINYRHVKRLSKFLHSYQRKQNSYSCLHCKKCFATNKSLAAHNILVHLPRYECDKCHKKILVRNREVHEKFHVSGSKSEYYFTCPICKIKCGAKFGEAHLKIHDNNEEHVSSISTKQPQISFDSKPTREKEPDIILLK